MTIHSCLEVKNEKDLRSWFKNEMNPVIGTSDILIVDNITWSQVAGIRLYHEYADGIFKNSNGKFRSFGFIKSSNTFNPATVVCDSYEEVYEAHIQKYIKLWKLDSRS